MQDVLDTRGPTGTYNGVDLTVNSFRKMQECKMIKRTDSGQMIQLKHIYDKTREDGSLWNRRDMESPETKAHIQDIITHLQKGGIVPAIEVQPREGGGVEKVDGHCRTEAYKAIDASGTGELWVSIVPFKGDTLKALARIKTSNHDRKLTPLENLDLFKSIRQELVDMGEKGSLQQIADEVGCTRQYVDQILKLDKLDDEGKQALSEGKINAAQALKVARTGVKEGKEAAKAALKTEVKRSAPKPLTASRALLDDMYVGMTDLFYSVPAEAKTAAAEFLKGDRPATDMVRIPVGELAKLMALKAEGDRQIEAAAERQMQKAEKAAQEEMGSDLDPVQKAAEPEPKAEHAEQPEENDEPDLSFL
ncbi:dsDNA partitioning protein [Pseudomonas phage DDSR119]|nr:dsDNA partitioning protein [Pseudomonas phage DDSR119]